MSNSLEHDDCDGESSAGCPSVDLIIKARAKDLGGFSVRRVLPFAKRRMVGPWVFFDHMGPANFAAGEGINVRPHPHVNLATVTYLFEGEILHRDSLGTEAAVLPGDLNLMVAGRGIVHSERERDEVKSKPHTVHGLQLWHALPAADEETEPGFYHYDKEEIPGTDVDGVPVRVMMGTAYGLTSPAKTFAGTLYVEAHLQAGQSLTLPQADERAVYMAQGAAAIGETAVDEFDMAVLTDKPGIALTAQTEARIALVGGENIGPRFLEWNFVSSRKDRLEQAKQDWQEGRFPKVPGDDEEFIPLPE